MLYKKNIIGTIGYMGGLPAVLEPFCWAWGQMIQYNTEYLCNPGEIVHYIKATVSLHFFARNSLVQQMRGDWLLMLDTDHAFEPDIAARMINVMNKNNLQVVTALYRHRAAPGGPVIYQWDKEDKFAMPIADWSKDVEAMQVGSAGAGCLLVKREVFDRIKAELKQEPFTLIEGYGEDHSFFKRCQKLGIDVYALPQIESPHLQITKLKMGDYKINQSVVSKDRTEVKGFK